MKVKVREIEGHEFYIEVYATKEDAEKVLKNEISFPEYAYVSKESKIHTGLADGWFIHYSTGEYMEID